MIRLEAFTVRRGGNVICSVPALEVAPGERVGIVGPNGCGKTTLLRALYGLETAFDGVCDVDVPASERAYLHQRPYLLRGSVLFNVAYGLRAHGVKAREARERSLRWLEALGIGDLAGRSVRALSGGEGKRVALARLLVLEPSLLLLDEPSSDLDTQGLAALKQVLEKLRGRTLLITSPRVLAEGWVDRTWSFTDDG